MRQCAEIFIAYDFISRNMYTYLVLYMCRSDIFCSISVVLRISPALRMRRRDGVVVDDVSVGSAGCCLHFEMQKCITVTRESGSVL